MKRKHIIHTLLLAVGLSAAACNTRQDTTAETGTMTEAGDQNLISGSTSKTWHADKHTNAEGDNEKLSRTERKNDQMIFNADGTFSMNTRQEAAGGNWMYDRTSQTLSLQFSGENHTESFKVLSLEEDQMELEAADGSTLELEAEG
ncbi:hypothetical protein SAMN05421823_11030 [Catalinimonas alkaloidigena]|uniref:Uncharacterized protein n=1 Tax=Catalinimonas alkaloidigena TaxID=1075417 RepID=A0A1G9Q584_9BACT|nr:DUF4923 family protein [Catalinimonas alkaloidigena]SDM05667.1 hypothetical protein SAMN05421823_11030 [Catalinimonas alkaloidigena]